MNLRTNITRTLLAVWMLWAVVQIPVTALAEEGSRIAVIDSQRIFAEYQPAQDAEAVFQEEMRQWKDELSEMEREILTTREKIKSQRLLLTKEKLDELQSGLDEKMRTYEQRQNELFDPNTGKVVTRNQELSAPINEQITNVVERIGAEEEYDLILDLATVNVVFVAEGVDITDTVLGELTSGDN